MCSVRGKLDHRFPGSAAQQAEILSLSLNHCLVHPRTLLLVLNRSTRPSVLTLPSRLPRGAQGSFCCTAEISFGGPPKAHNPLFRLCIQGPARRCHRGKVRLPRGAQPPPQRHSAVAAPPLRLHVSCPRLVKLGLRRVGGSPLRLRLCAPLTQLEIPSAVPQPSSRSLHTTSSLSLPRWAS